MWCETEKHGIIFKIADRYCVTGENKKIIINNLQWYLGYNLTRVVSVSMFHLFLCVRCHVMTVKVVTRLVTQQNATYKIK